MDNQLITITGNPVFTSNPDGSLVSAMTDRNGALIVRQVGGNRYASAVRGNVFSGGSLVAGVTLIGPIAGTTLASTAGLVNPAGSGVNVELISVSLATQTIAVALKPFALGVQINASQLGGIPSSVTKQPSIGLPYGAPGLSPQAFTYSAATLNFTSGHEVFDVNLYPWTTLQTAVGAGASGTRYFDGELILAPDSNICAYNVVTALATVAVTWTWAEWPI